jgi:transcriptional regulator with GAF, ATPase, and Fis domain
MLRIFRKNKFQLLDSSVLIKTNGHINASTFHNLEDYVAAEKFRSDLYCRLNVFPIYFPPLRERENEIILRAGTNRKAADSMDDKVVGAAMISLL